MPAAAVIRRVQALSGFIGFKGCVGGYLRSVVKACSLTVEVPLILDSLSIDEVGGIYGVAVKCIDTIKNTDSVGSLLDYN